MKSSIERPNGVSIILYPIEKKNSEAIPAPQ